MNRYFGRGVHPNVADGWRTLSSSSDYTCHTELFFHLVLLARFFLSDFLLRRGE